MKNQQLICTILILQQLHPFQSELQIFLTPFLNLYLSLKKYIKLDGDLHSILDSITQFLLTNINFFK
jgi:uncharacterized protein (DUF1919 family)